MTTSATQLTNKPFRHIIFANKREHDFAYSSEADKFLRSVSEGGKGSIDAAQDLVADEIIKIVADLPLRSSIIRGFKRFGEDAEYDEDNSLDIIAEAMISARDSYVEKSQLEEASFKDVLIDRVNESIEGESIGDAVSEWDILNDIRGEIGTLVEDTARFYSLSLSKDVIIDMVMDACDKACENFAKEHDKSSGLDLLARGGGIQVLIAPYSRSIDDGNNTISISNFNEVGVGGLRPTDSVISLLRMTGVTPLQVIAELRDEMDSDVLKEWSSLASNEIDYYVEKGSTGIHDILDIVEQCGERGGIPCYLTEMAPSFLGDIDAGESVNFSRLGVTMIPHDSEIDLPSVKVIEKTVNLDYSPEKMMPAHGMGLDFMKASSLKQGELDGKPKRCDLDISIESHNEISP